MIIAGRPRAGFARMIDGTADDWAIIESEAAEHAKGLPSRILTHLKLLENDFGGFAVDRLEHSLQCATRAAEDGRDDEYVACSLLHDIGDTLGPMNHERIAAAILQPFVSERMHWVVGHHGIFQGYYFFEHFGLEKNMRDNYKDHEFYGDCEEFCRKYDQTSFDPTYSSMPLAEFEPVIQKIMTEPRQSIYLAEQ